MEEKEQTLPDDIVAILFAAKFQDLQLVGTPD